MIHDGLNCIKYELKFTKHLDPKRTINYSLFKNCQVKDKSKVVIETFMMLIEYTI